jgi:hypothetical protein
MTVALTTPITGAAQTGLTSPTYTLTSDTPPNANSKQWAVTALGGTQTGVIPHSVAAPFTLAYFRPINFKSLTPVNAATGQLRAVPINTYKCVTRKGVLPLAGQAFVSARATTVLDIPAGSDIADPASLRAMLSAHIGALQQIAAGLGDTVVNGVL